MGSAAGKGNRKNLDTSRTTSVVGIGPGVVEPIEKQWTDKLERESLLEEEEKKHKELLFKHPEMEPILSIILKKSLRLQEISEKISVAGEKPELRVYEVFLAVVANIASLWATWANKEQRRLIGYQLVAKGSFGRSCSDVYKAAMIQFGPITPQNIDSMGGTFLSSMIKLLRNIADECLLLAHEMQEFGILEISINKVLAGAESILNWKANREWATWIHLNSGFVYNCAKIGVSRRFFKSIDALNAVVPLLKHEYEDEYSAGPIKRDALMTLAYLVDDEDKDLLQMDKNILNVVVNMFVEAVKSVEMRAIDNWGTSWSVEEMTMNLSRLASNDKNKRPIMELGVLPYMVELAEKGDEEQQQYTVELFWSLSFNEDNQRDMGASPKAICALKSLAKSSNSRRVQRASQGVLWNIRATKPESIATTGEEVAQKEAKNTHIMISYQWDVQKLVKKVRNSLKNNGYKVWLDLERMGGYTLEAMAQAVEEAAVVIVCMSSKYKDSANCRQEAGYASDLKKKIVPLMVEKDYKPNGWLGFLVGAKYYIDFTTKSFPLCLEELVKELGSSGQEVPGGQQIGLESNNNFQASNGEPTMVVTKQVAKSGFNLANWTNKEVQSWLRNNDIHCEKMMDMTGEEILTLVRIKTEAPEFFFNYIKQDLEIKTIKEIGKLLKAIACL